MTHTLKSLPAQSSRKALEKSQYAVHLQQTTLPRMVRTVVTKYLSNVEGELEETD
jgi:hypothetical protein